MKNVSQQVVNQIKQKHLKPKPRWQFVIKDTIFWSTFVLSIGVGAVAFSGFLYRITSSDWSIYQQLGRGPIPHFFLTLPYLWIALMVGFSILAIYNFRHTKKGYRHKPIIIITVSLVSGIALGTVLFLVGGGHQVDHQLFGRQPMAKVFYEKRLKHWQQPEKGLLSGEIVELESSDWLILEDLVGEEWHVVYRKDISSPLIIVGTEVKIVGEIIGEQQFEAERIRPIKPRAPWPLLSPKQHLKEK